MWPRIFFTFYVVTVIISFMVTISDLAFGNPSAKRVWIRLLLALIWPLALFSKAGRDYLFNKGGIK